MGRKRVTGCPNCGGLIGVCPRCDGKGWSEIDNGLVPSVFIGLFGKGKDTHECKMCDGKGLLRCRCLGG